MVTLAKSDPKNFQFFDPSIPEQETVLTDYDFNMIGHFRDNDQWFVNDSAMYNPLRFEGDIGKCIFSKSSNLPLNVFEI